MPVEIAVVVPLYRPRALGVGGDRGDEASQAGVAAHVESVARRGGSGVGDRAGEGLVPCSDERCIHREGAYIVGHIPGI